MDISQLPTTILDEAIDALDTGIEFYLNSKNKPRARYLKLAVIQLHRFVEYIFKYIVATDRPILIFQDAFKDLNLKKAKTIGLTEAMNYFINNIQYGTKSRRTKKAGRIKKQIEKLKRFRDKVNHFYVEPIEMYDFELELSNVTQVVLEDCLAKDLKQKIYNRLTLKNSKFLKNFITKQWRKEEGAIKKVEKYEKRSGYGKDANPLLTPLYMCPECLKDTFILSRGNKKFSCTYCPHSENAGRCDFKYNCSGGSIPESLLRLWDDEEDIRRNICDDCYEYYNARLNKS